MKRTLTLDFVTQQTMGQHFVPKTIT